MVALMAANWKRPWAEEEETPYVLREGKSLSEASYRPDMSDGGSSSPSRRPSIASDSISMIPQSFPSSQTSNDSRLNGQTPQRYEMYPAKRPRLEADDHTRSAWGERPLSGPRDKIELPMPSISKDKGYSLSQYTPARKDVPSPPFHGYGGDLSKPAGVGYVDRSCQSCSGVGSTIPRLADGLAKLQANLRAALGEKVKDTEHKDPRASGPVPEGVLQGLDWSMERLAENIDLAKEILSATSLARERPPVGPSVTANAIANTDRGKIRRSSSTVEDFSRQPPQSPSAATFGTRANHPLPSPVSMSFPTGGLPPSPSATQSSPHTAHLQELQHQLSTKTLAHQILNGEHDKLLSAYSRLQTRCSALDKKSTVSEAEINNLYEEKSRLQTELEIAQGSIKDLEGKAKDSLDNAEKNSSQFMKMMDLVSKQNTKAYEERQKREAEREAWAKEREAFELKIQKLSAGADPADLVPVSGSESVESLKEEVSRLKARARAAEDRVRAHEDEADKIASFSRELEALGQRLRG